MKRGRMLIILGILLGLIVFVAVFYVLSQPRGQEAPVEKVDLVVALQEIPERTQVQAAWVQLKPFLKESEPVGAQRKLENVVGKTTIRRIYTGEPILEAMIAMTNTLYGVPYLLKEGEVAVAFPLTELSGVAGAIRAGDTVDLLLSLGVPAQATEAGGGRVTTQLTLQDVKVLHVGAWVATSQSAGGSADTGTAAVMIFQVTRQDALILKWVRENGTVDFALRPATDHATVDLGAIQPVQIDYIIETYRFPRPPATGK